MKKCAGYIAEKDQLREGVAQDAGSQLITSGALRQGLLLCLGMYCISHWRQTASLTASVLDEGFKRVGLGLPPAHELFLRHVAIAILVENEHGGLQFVLR